MNSPGNSSNFNGHLIEYLLNFLGISTTTVVQHFALQQDDGPKTAQDDPKTVPGRTKDAQDGSKAALDAPGRHQDGRKTVQDGSKAVQGRP